MLTRMSKDKHDNERTTGVFFELVRRGLWADVNLNLDHQVNDDVAWGEVWRLAEEQGVVGLVSAGIDWLRVRNSGFFCPQEWTLQFVGQTMQVEQRNIAMNAFIATLIKRLRTANIYALLVKGQGVAQSYANPKWRTGGDVDLYLSDENYENAKKFLIPLSASVEKEYVREKHLGMIVDGWVVELHGSLYSGLSSRLEREIDDVHKDTFTRGNVRSWWNNNVQVFQLAVENDVFYVFTHILQHFYKGGIGLRQICDWCRLLWCYRAELNVKLLGSRVNRAGLMTEWKAFGAFAVKYLGMPEEAMPFYSVDKKWMQNAHRICKFIIEVGNFGHNRDRGYFEKYPYIIRKACSLSLRCRDLWMHAALFPLDSLRFFPRMMYNGVRSAMRGE